MSGPALELVPAGELLALATDAARSAGTPDSEARLLARSLVDASLRGVDSHGVNLLPEYLARIAAGGWTTPTAAAVVRGRAAIALVDGRDGVGVVTATLAMDEAIERAQQYGISAVAVTNGSHFGAAAYYARMALRHHQVGVVLTNASPAMAPHGGVERLLSNNPWSIAVPSNEDFDVVLDIANSVVARSWIRLAAQTGRDIPTGWAVDRQGRPTTDAHEALAGTLLPLAGHKGYGIAFMVDVLAGILSGAAFGPAVRSPFPIELRGDGEALERDSYRPQRVGHLFIAIQVDDFRPIADFSADVSAFAARLRLSRPAPGVDRVRVPGEPEHETEQTRRRDGIPVREEVLAVLRTRTAASVGSQSTETQ